MKTLHLKVELRKISLQEIGTLNLHNPGHFPRWWIMEVSLEGNRQKYQWFSHFLRSLAAAKRPPMATRAKRVTPAKAEFFYLASAKKLYTGCKKVTWTPGSQCGSPRTKTPNYYHGEADRAVGPVGRAYTLKKILPPSRAYNSIRMRDIKIFAFKKFLHCMVINKKTT